jgi:hypothetical protein
MNDGSYLTRSPRRIAAPFSRRAVGAARICRSRRAEWGAGEVWAFGCDMAIMWAPPNKNTEKHTAQTQAQIKQTFSNNKTQKTNKTNRIIHIHTVKQEKHKTNNDEPRRKTNTNNNKQPQTQHTTQTHNNDCQKT